MKTISLPEEYMLQYMDETRFLILKMFVDSPDGRVVGTFDSIVETLGRDKNRITQIFQEMKKSGCIRRIQRATKTKLSIYERCWDIPKSEGE
jgi:hypothetical protein